MSEAIIKLGAKVIVSWPCSAVLLWFAEFLGAFQVFGLNDLGIVHLTWAQRFGVALLIVALTP